MYYIKVRDEAGGEKLYRIECEEHGEIYPGWRPFEELPVKLKAPLIMLRIGACGEDKIVVDGVGEEISPTEYLVY